MQAKTALEAYLINHYPGIYTLGSEDEAGLVSRQKQHQKPGKFKYSKELAGVGGGDDQSSWNMVH